MAPTPASARWADVFVVGELDPLVDFTDSRATPCVINGSSSQSSLDKIRSADSPQKQQNSQATDGATDICSICESILLTLRGHSPLSMITLGSGEEVLQANSRCTDHLALVTAVLRLDSSSILAVAQYIEHLKVHQNPGTMSTIITAEMFPRSPIPRPLLSAMYLVREADSAENRVAGRIIDPQWINSSLPGLWKTTCARLHDGLCKGFPDKFLSSIRPVRLVDVKRQCIVTAPKDSSYVALSYVWGNQVTLQTKRSNISQLQQPGSLLRNNSYIPIARTIRDAMGLVKLLDERYLWVDSLCIIQDDDAQKHLEIGNMAAIYANATISILAVQGEHANSGLKGFYDFSEPRNSNQTIHCLAGSVRIIQHPIKPEDLEVGTETPVWGTRGWTYQENLFSRRILVFDGDSVRWECAAAIWREHVEQATVLPQSSGRPESWKSIFQRSIPDLNQLDSILCDYNRRTFTYPEDTLQAFAGISFALSTSFAGGFLSGLPISLFDIAILWQPDEKISRRSARDLNHRHHLPSWSWAGWYGKVNFDDTSASDFIRNDPGFVKYTRERRIVRTLSWSFHETATSPGTQVHASILDSRDLWLEDRIQLTPGWSKHGISESPEAFYEPPEPRASPSQFFYRHEALPGYEFWYPIPLLQSGEEISGAIAPYISCVTWRIWLFPREELPKNNGYRPILSLRDKKGTWAGALQPHDNLDASGGALEDLNSPLELVEIAKGFCRDATSPWPGIEEIRHPERPRLGQWYEYYWVMWVGWTGTIAHRKGLGRVQKDIWEQQSGDYFSMILG